MTHSSVAARRLQILSTLAAAAILVAGCSSSATSESTTAVASASASATVSASPTAFAPLPTEAPTDAPVFDTMADITSQPVDWTPCLEATGSCAYVWVPIDYDDFSVGLTPLRLFKRTPTNGQPAPNGALFFNPGGPGVSGVAIVPEVERLIATSAGGTASQLLDAYDIVGFDPRGVGGSTGLVCLTDAQLDARYQMDLTPDSPKELEAIKQSVILEGNECEKNNGPLASHVTTVETAKDLDVLRQLLGQDKLNYLGYSYGTYLGATYAALFPGNINRMVLDGVKDPNQSQSQMALGQAGGFQKAFDAWAASCAQGTEAVPTCPMGTSVEQINEEIAQFLRDLEKKPVPTSDPNRPLTKALGFYGISAALYNPGAWDKLSTALGDALDGDGDALMALSDALLGRDANGHYSTEGAAQEAINALDAQVNPSAKQATHEEFRQASPVFGPFLSFSDIFGYWPLKTKITQPDYTAKGAPPILVVGTTRDPATPYENSVRLAKQLESGTLISRDGDGHTAYLSTNACLNDAVTKYLVDGTVPPNGTFCDAEPVQSASPSPSN